MQLFPSLQYRGTRQLYGIHKRGFVAVSVHHPHVSMDYCTCTGLSTSDYRLVCVTREVTNAAIGHIIY